MTRKNIFNHWVYYAYIYQDLVLLQVWDTGYSVMKDVNYDLSFKSTNRYFSPK